MDVAFGGAFYASRRGARSSPRELPRLIELGRELKAAIEAEHDVVHPLEPELRDVYGVIFWEHVEDGPPLVQRNVTVFADGEVDRSPCGSGTSARLALLDRSGRLPRGAELRHLSIVGTEFRARVVGGAEVAGIPAVVTEVEGSAFRTGAPRLRARPRRPARNRLPAALSAAYDRRRVRHPIYLAVTDDRRRSRLTVFFRLLLAIPHFFWIAIWTLAVPSAVLAQWCFTLVAGRPASLFFRFLASYLRYATHLSAYVFLLANPFPRFLGRPGYPVDLVVDPPAPQRRWKTAIRPVLAIPPVVFASVLGQVIWVVAALGWFACLAVGRMPKGMRDLGAYCLRYQQQTAGYLFLLTDRYPTIESEAPRERPGPVRLAFV